MALPEEADRLRGIWAESFDEDPAYAAAFLRVFPPERHCLVCEVDDVPVSMVWMLDATLHIRGRAAAAQYIYAAATLPAYRGRGIFGELLREAQQHAKRKGQLASFLRPAKPGLFSYYQRFGYVPAFYAATDTYPRAQLLEGSASLPLTLASPAEYAAARRAYRRELPICVEWDESVLAYARYLAGGNGGLAVTPKGCAVCEPDSGDPCVLQVRELFCAPADRQAVLETMARQFTCQIIRVTRPAGNGEAQPYGVLCPLDDVLFPADWVSADPSPYMGLSLE